MYQQLVTFCLQIMICYLIDTTFQKNLFRPCPPSLLLLLCYLRTTKELMFILKEMFFTEKSTLRLHILPDFGCVKLQSHWLQMEVKLRTVPTFVTVHTFYVPQDTQVSYQWCLLIQGYFCAV